MKKIKEKDPDIKTRAICPMCGENIESHPQRGGSIMKPKTGALSILLKKANENYPDGQIGDYFNLKTGEESPDHRGDTLALFIGREIIGVYDDMNTLEENACNAYNALSNAIAELRRVRDAMERVK